MLTNWGICTLNIIRSIWIGILTGHGILDSRRRKLIHTLKTLLKLCKTLYTKRISHLGSLIKIMSYKVIMKNSLENCGWLSSIVVKKSLNHWKKSTKDSNSKTCTKTLMIMMKVQLAIPPKSILVAVWRKTLEKWCRLWKVRCNWSQEEQR